MSTSLNSLRIGRPVWLILITLVIGLISYFTIGSPFVRPPNSDSAVHVLMAQDFNLKRDFYYWAQNRIGSFAPMVARPLTALGMSALLAVYLVRYLMLAAVALIICSQLKSWLYRILTILLLMFPPLPYIWMLEPGHPYAEQFFLLLLPSWMIWRRLRAFQPLTGWLLAGAAFLFGLAMWVSDASLFYIIILTGWLLIMLIKQNLKVKAITFISTFMLPIVACIIGLLIIKHNTSDHSGYTDQSMVSAGDFFTTAVSWTDNITTLISSGVVNSTHSFYLLLIAFSASGIVLVAVRLLQFKTISQSLNIPLIFIAFAGTLYVIICLSGWYAINWHNSRYMIPVFYFFCVGIFLLIEEQLTQKSYPFKIMSALLPIAVCAAGMYSLKDYRNHSVYTVNADFQEQTEQIKGHGIIADYWYSYSLAAFDPKNITATPHDKAFYRGNHLVWKTLDRPVIYLIKNDWLEAFPDTIYQFETRLVRKIPHEVIAIDKAELSAYEKK